MSKYERMTNKDWRENYDLFEGVCCDTCIEDCGECNLNYNALVRLAELEDKIEAGTLIELPCKVGDTVYYVSFSFGDFMHDNGELEAKNGFNVHKCTIRNKADIYHYLEQHELERAFLYKEQAEQKLKEMEVEECSKEK